MPRKKSKPEAPTPERHESRTELEEWVRRRAYELYELRGHEHGHDVDDWLRAESELMSERNKVPAGQNSTTARKARSQRSTKKSSGRSKTSKSPPRGMTTEERNGN